MNTRLISIQDWGEMAEQAAWSVAHLAKLCRVSVRSLERYFATEMGKSPKAWLIEQRQKRARELLRDRCTVKETAVFLSFKHSSHLTNAFKNHWGHSPTG